MSFSKLTETNRREASASNHGGITETRFIITHETPKIIDKIYETTVCKILDIRQQSIVIQKYDQQTR